MCLFAAHGEIGCHPSHWVEKKKWFHPIFRAAHIAYEYAMSGTCAATLFVYDSYDGDGLSRRRRQWRCGDRNVG